MRRNNKKSLAIILSMMMVLVIGATACKEATKEKPASATSVSENKKKDNEKKEGKENQDNKEAQENVIGEGNTVFNFTVTDADGKETSYEIHTDKETVGDALLELKLIDGDQGDYGLYVKTVDGITVDFDKDGKYWAFYVDGEYATAGVDATKIEKSSKYALKVE